MSLVQVDVAKHSLDEDDAADPADDGEDEDEDSASDGEESVESARMVKTVKKGLVPNDPYLPAHVSNNVRRAMVACRAYVQCPGSPLCAAACACDVAWPCQAHVYARGTEVFACTLNQTNVKNNNNKVWR